MYAKHRSADTYNGALDEAVVRAHGHADNGAHAQDLVDQGRLGAELVVLEVLGGALLEHAVKAVLVERELHRLGGELQLLLGSRTAKEKSMR